jgi:hypothetical protein
MKADDMDTKQTTGRSGSRRALSHAAHLIRKVLADADRFLSLEALLLQIQARFGEAIPEGRARDILESDARLRARLFIRTLSGKDHYYLAPADLRRSSRSLPDHPMVRVVRHEASAAGGRRLSAFERFAQGL